MCQEKGSGSALEAVTDSASQAAQTMRSNLMKAGNFVAGNDADVTEDSQSSARTGTLEPQDDPADTMIEKFDGNLEAEDLSESDRDSNNAAEKVKETSTGLANARQNERGEDSTAQVDEFGSDFGEQARHFQVW